MHEFTSLYGVREGDLYTSNWRDVWRIEWENEHGIPVLVLVNVRTGEIRGDYGETLDLTQFEKLWSHDMATKLLN